MKSYHASTLIYLLGTLFKSPEHVIRTIAINIQETKHVCMPLVANL